MRKPVSLLGVAALVIATTSCGDAVRQGSAPAYVVIDQITGTSGADTSQTGSTLLSDVLTVVTNGSGCTTDTPCPTVFNDTGQAILRLVPRDVGTPGAPSALNSNNEVTITRYHVDYIRADGHNVQGVDVPYAFDGAATGTVPATGNLTLGFELVRNIAKKESPLVQLATNGVIITTIAEVTFYGQDRTGNAASVVGRIQIDFGNFVDK